MNVHGRLSGILLPLFSLRSKSDFGIGDFGALESFFSWMEVAKQRMWMTLPLLPTATGDSSPYATRCAFGLNPLFIHLEGVPEFVELGGITALSKEERTELEHAQNSSRIQYQKVFKLKREALKRAFTDFEEKHWKTGSQRAQGLKQYEQEQRTWLDSFTLFTAISRDRQYQGWWEWPEGLRDRHGDSLEKERTRLEQEIRFQSWLQWTAESQWAEVRSSAQRHNILLCGDEPFIIGQDSADVWANPHLLRRDARLGVPPDDFSATGQDWGLPYFDFAAIEAKNFEWIRYRSQRSAAYYDVRRVDHAVGYFRQWIRDDVHPQGRFLPAEESEQRALGSKVFAILSEAAGIVAEDLGVIPPFVRETLAALGIPGYKVMRWERDQMVYRNPHFYPKKSLATTGTHDTETLKEWWEGSPVVEKSAAGKGYPELRSLDPLPEFFTPEVHRCLLEAAENSASEMCVFPWQDVIGVSDRINLPGSVADANWSYRIDWNAEDLLTHDRPKQAAGLLAELTRQGGRA